MRLFSARHEYDYSWEEVSTNNWRKYCPWNDKAEHVIGVDVLNRVLDHYGLSLSDWAGSVYTLRDRKGRSAVVTDIGTLWGEAEKLAGRPLDPLNPKLLESLAVA